MINVSNEFQQLMSKRTDFKQNAEITFANGEVLTLTEKDFTLSNNMVTDAGESNGIPLGVAVCRNIQIELMNDDERFSDYDFFGARIRLFLTFQLSETVERIEYGTFTVLTPETYGITVIITALDDMYKADVAYNTTLVYPATLGEILRDACNLADISQGDTTFLNDDFVVQSKPEDITIRQLLGYVAMIAGGNARIDTTGRLKIISYNFDGLESIRNNIDGGSFNPWQSKADLDGGDFTYNIGDVADGGTFTDAINYHIMTMWSDLKVDTDDIVITGIKTEYTNDDNEEMTAEYGVSGYVLQVENPLFVGNEQTAIDLIGNVMVGGRFRQFSGDIVANPTIEFMDVVAVIDRKNNVYVSFVTDINFEFFGFTSIKNSAEPTLRNSAKTYSEATKTLVSARKLVKNERSARERAVEQLANDLSKSSGLFMTQEEQSDGSIIYYMHDKSTLAESMIIWKLTALAFGISTDGGKTYPYGFTVNGETITRLLYAEGIDADYITSGTIDASKITVTNLNANNIKTGKITDKNGYATIDLDSGDISITSSHFSWSSTYSSLTKDGKLKATDVDISGKITASTGKIGGFDIGTTSIYNGKSSLLSDSSGVYIGTDGIALGTAEGFKVTPKGDVYIGYAGSLTVDGKITLSDPTEASFYYNSIEKIEFSGSSVNIKNGDLAIYTGNLKMEGSTSYITGSLTTNQKIKFETSKTTIIDTYAILGKSGGYVGFFGNDGKTKQTVSNITTPSSATASDVATKINALLTALRSYNLIG